MITQELKDLVRSELENLKAFAYEHELERLNLDKFNTKAMHLNRSIYGQLTGNFTSTRAEILLNVCSKPYSQRMAFYVKSESQHYTATQARNFSPLEFYVSDPSANIIGIINFLQDKTQTVFL